MKNLSFLLLLPLLLFTTAAFAQEDCGGEEMTLSLSDAGSLMGTAETHAETPAETTAETSTSSVTGSALTRAETSVRDIITQDGIHVVHFWAPWCINSKRELSGGWANLVNDNPDVSFTFVTIWNQGESGAREMRTFDIPNRVREITAETPSGDGRIDEFLGLPVTWVPSTWIFHENGELSFAMNYGEMEMQTIGRLLDITEQNW